MQLVITKNTEELYWLEGGRLGQVHKMLEADGALTTVLLTFFGIPVSFLLSLLSLYQFKRAFVLISLLSQKRVKNSYWRAVRPCKPSLFIG